MWFLVMTLAFPTYLLANFFPFLAQAINKRRLGGHVWLAVLVLAIGTMPAVGYAATLPGPADAGRIDQREQSRTLQPNLSASAAPVQIFPAPNAPEQSKHIYVILTDVRITGMQVFTTEDIKDIYAPYIGFKTTLDSIWAIAAQLTERYRDEGYFLSRVIVPQQKVEDGIVTLRVVEGYIGEVKLEGPLAENEIVKQWIDKVQSYRPVKAAQIESVLLHLNDLPGVNLRAVLEPMQPVESTEGAVRLVLEPKEEPVVTGSISFDNNGSRYLGPYEAQIQVQAVILPTQRTTATWFSSLPWDDVKYGSLKHELPLFSAATLELYGSYTNAVPGYTLKPDEIKSTSATLGIAFEYSLIRQRQENLNARLAFESRDTESDILGTPLTRDYVRALRASLNYQLADSWNGQNAFNGALSQGLSILGASRPDQQNLSRAGARPDFTKFNLDASRLQSLTGSWDMLTAVSGQLASAPLYASEQFGYGGQAFGRAYDNSEITGDHGISGSAELRYGGVETWHGFQPTPYGFYDIGTVWNQHDQTTPSTSGSSVGLGVRLLSECGLAGDVGLAFPLTRAIATPISGNGKNPRYYMWVSYKL
jgi:hemolysin activation/secretion protein